MASASSAAGMRPSDLKVLVEHDDRLVVARSGEAVPGAFRDRGSMRALNACDFAEKRAGVFVDYHHAIQASDKEAVIRRVGHDIVPATVSAKCVGVRHPVGGSGLRQSQNGGEQGQDAVAHGGVSA